MTVRGGLDRLDAELAQSGVRFADAEMEGEGSVTLDKTTFVSGDSVKLSIVGGENHILVDLLINGQSVYDDFTANAVIVGTHTEYMIQNATQNIHVKAVFQFLSRRCVQREAFRRRRRLFFCGHRDICVP